VDAGARYLRELLIKYLDDPYQVRKALAAYNAGPAAVDRFDGIPPFPETQRYVRKVLQRHAALTQYGLRPQELALLYFKMRRGVRRPSL